MGMTAAVIAGTLVGAVTSGFNAYEQKRAGDRQASAAKEQLAQQQALAQEEDQARNKANRKQADLDGLLADNTIDNGLGSTLLTNGNAAPLNPGALGTGSSLLGG